MVSWYSGVLAMQDCNSHAMYHLGANEKSKNVLDSLDKPWVCCCLGANSGSEE